MQNVVIDRNEDAMKFAKVGLRKVRPLTVGDKLCLSPDHEVLTSKGWKNIKKISYEDKIATLNPDNNNLEWHKPSNVYNFDHEGEMYEIENSLISLKTTMNHKMYVKRSPDDMFNLEEAKNIIGDKVWYKRNCINNNTEIKNIIFPSVVLPWCNSFRKYERISYPMNSWLLFLGIYLSEGHIDNARNIRISAHKPRVLNALVKALNDMKIEYLTYPGEENYVYIKNHQISNYLKQFGKANDKYIPSMCRNMGPINSKILLDSLLLGDGYENPEKNSWEYYTNSKKLADGVQILSIMCGMSSTIKIKNLKDEVVIIKGIETKRTSNQYRVYISNYKPILEPCSSYKQYSEVVDDSYSGKVYCLEVPNHIFMVRRNDKYCWTGNSSRAG